MQQEKITLDNEKDYLKDLYPLVPFNGSVVKYDPKKHTLEKGEAVFCLNIEEGTISPGVISKVSLSDPSKLPIYHVNDSTFMYHRVWPDIEGQKKLGKLKIETLKSLSKEQKASIGVFE